MKQGKTSTAIWVFGSLFAIGIIAIVYTAYTMESIPNNLPGTGPATTGGIQAGGVCASACPDTLTWTGVINIENGLNSTGTETYDTTMYFFDTATGELKTSITDTSSGAVTLECGKKYKGEVISTSGAAGDSAAILAAPKESTIGANGEVEFTACGSGNTLTFGSQQHGVPEVRAFDVINDAFCYDDDNGDPTNTKDYETDDGISFSGTSSNTSCISVGTNGELHVKEYVRANVEDQDINDLGMWILVDAPTSTWQKPTVKIDGVEATEASGQLNADERLAYNDYEYVYYVPPTKHITKTNELTFDLSIFALSGQDPSAASNVSIDYAPIGRYASQLNTNVLKIGAVDDSSSRTDIHTRHDTIICTA